MSCKGIRSGFEISNKINYFVQNNTGNLENDRRDIRDKLVDLFKSESVGQGKGSKSTRVVYCVEQVGEEIIYLKRPAPLNKGFDFEIHTKNKLFEGRIKSRPRHQDIINNLKFLKDTYPEDYKEIQQVIDEIYLCNEEHIDSIDLGFKNLNVTIILKLIKWLFLEQDITYWSFSGREMFYKAIKSV